MSLSCQTLQNNKRLWSLNREKVIMKILINIESNGEFGSDIESIDQV